MGNTMFSVILWIAAGVVLAVYLLRRRQRRTLR